MEARLGETAGGGGGLRTLYETWIAGHTLLLSEEHEVEEAFRYSRYHEDQVLKAFGQSSSYEEKYPTGRKMPGMWARAQALSDKLALGDDPRVVGLPVSIYELIFRTQSILGTHAQFSIILSYADMKRGIMVAQDSEKHTYKAVYGALLVNFFVQQLFKQAQAANQGT